MITQKPEKEITDQQVEVLVAEMRDLIDGLDTWLELADEVLKKAVRAAQIIRAGKITPEAFDESAELTRDITEFTDEATPKAALMLRRGAEIAKELAVLTPNASGKAKYDALKIAGRAAAQQRRAFKILNPENGFIDQVKTILGGGVEDRWLT